jgi:hypothetical protein
MTNFVNCRPEEALKDVRIQVVFEEQNGARLLVHALARVRAADGGT